MPPLKASTGPSLRGTFLSAVDRLSFKKRWKSNRWWMGINFSLFTVLFVDVVWSDFRLGTCFCDSESCSRLLRYAESALLTLFFLNFSVWLLSIWNFVSTAQLNGRQLQLIGFPAKEGSPAKESAKTDSRGLSPWLWSPSGCELAWLFKLRRHEESLPYSPGQRTPSLSPPSSYPTPTNPPSPSPGSLDRSFGVYQPEASQFSDALLRLRRARSSSPFVCRSAFRSNRQLREYLHQVEKSQPNDFKSILSSPSFSSVAKSYEVATVDLPSPLRIDEEESFPSLSSLKATISSTPSIHVKTTTKYEEAKMSAMEEAKPRELVLASASHSSRPLLAQVPLWMRYGLNPEQVDIHTEKLRSWISRTILKPLVEEVKATNSQLMSASRPDLLVGEASLASLQHALTSRTSDQLLGLHRLLPYLELSSNQRYLVQRIKELARGGCLGAFDWDGGGSDDSEGRKRAWGKHLPTDSALVWHLLCAYLDGQLPPDPLCPEGKSFSARYCQSASSKPTTLQSTPTATYILEAPDHPPHYQLVIGGGAETLDPGKGSNNVFHAFLLFILHLKEHLDGHLGLVSIGESGLNVLWVLDD